MTREEAVARIKDHIEIHRYHERDAVKIFEALDMAIKALRQPEPCEDAVSREAVNKLLEDGWKKGIYPSRSNVAALPPVTPKPKAYCKECKHYDPSTWKEDSGWCNVEDDCEAGIEMTPYDYCSRGERR